MNTQSSSAPDNLANPNSLIEQMIRRASGARPSCSNEITVLLDSTENFPAWEAALRSARESICIEMYIFAPDEFGKTIRQILLEKLAEGVAVALVYDWLGSINAHLRGFFKPLIEAGAEVRSYNPPGWFGGLSILSRNHRKSIVIDEHTAFVSGLCISSAWQGNPARGISVWRDTGLQLQGPVVEDILAAFEDTLVSQGGKMPANLRNYEHGESQPAGSSCARILATTPANTNTIRLDLSVISLAQQNIWITDAYFMPTRMYVQALVNAANAGVDVRILVPRTSDIKWIGTVSRTQYRQLLEAGVRVFEWNGTMIHAKSALIDGQWARVGSTNLNLSSWYANRELDVSIEDPATVYQLERIFLQDLESATEVVLDPKARVKPNAERSPIYRNAKMLHRGQMKGMMRQVMQLSYVFDNNIAQTRLVDQSEAWAYLAIGTVFLFIAALLWFFPQILVWPLLFLLIFGGLGTCFNAAKQIRHFKSRNR
ncbi:MAG: phosphatidylserine/phosphatidylglycerophosphate/cardiolipin synthase family protein [Neisseria sp.]|uniref:phospholipase D-like domain-containing protein n=1 Tax=Neisseria sp. TaxID=192066 RepID=UPI0026DBC8FF|nr:phosphatidylserine/phosphatidylglycerophosphate/cardiolipin synthase family protein [Neisseria sp.]MDO4640125.1 phosphatidylserine/phosphatidylglycerophosphate/cardiolipin synthase family protein [Neisseria sp.]